MKKGKSKISRALGWKIKSARTGMNGTENVND